MTDSLKWPLGKQNAAARKAKLTLKEWRAQQSAVQEKPAAAPDMAFHTAGPDAALKEIAE